MKKSIALLLAILFVLPTLFITAVAVTNGEDKTFFIDGINVTRWEETSVVYINRETTEQNEWGVNVVVDSTGKVTEIIKGGDIKGKNLPIPDKGMVVSATSSKAKWLEDNVEVGDFVSFDSVSSRVIISKDNDFSPYYSESHAITGFNQIRYSNTFIIYDKAGKTTETNIYGLEAVVGSDGVVISVGGNNNLIPEGGYVISATEKVDREFIKMYAVPGAKAEISSDRKTLTLTYDKETLKTEIEMKITEVEEKLNYAKGNFYNIPYDELEAQIKAIKETEIGDTVKERNELTSKINACFYAISETPSVELRGIWHKSVEKNAAEVEKVVEDLKKAGINQLNLGISGSYDTIIPLPSDFPFKQKSSLRGADILQFYIDECKEAGIELIITLPIFYNDAGANTKFPQWLTKSNGAKDVDDESVNFFNPASEEYREYILKFIKFLLENYEIDGLQLDYIRYPVAMWGIDYGYDDITKNLFAEKFNVDKSVVDEIATELQSHSMWNDWVQFKADIVTSYVTDIKELCETVRPDIYLSAAVANDTVLHYYCQDIREWSKQELLDAIYPMSYGENVLSGKIPEFSGYAGDDTYLFMGSGAFLTLSEFEIFRQATDSRYQADGIAYFEYFTYLSHGYADFLKTNAYREEAITPTLDASAAADAQVDFMIRRINDVILPLGGITKEKADSIIALLKNAVLDSENIATLNEQLEAEISGIAGENAIKSDLAKLTKIVIMSKDAEKDVYPGVTKEESSVSDEESVAESQEDSNSKSEPSAATSLWIAIGVLSVLIVTAVVVFIVKKRK